MLRFTGLAITMVVARILAIEEYGRLELLVTSATILTAFASLQSEGGLLRFYYPAGEERPRLLFTHLATIALVGSGVAIVGVVAAPGLARLWPEAGFSPGEIRLGGALVLGNLIYNHTLTCFRAARRPKAAVGLALGTSLAQLGLVVVLAGWLGMGIKGVVGARVLAELGAFGVVVLVDRARYRPPFSLEWLRQLMSYSLPLALETFVSMVLFHFTRYFLTNALGPGALGLFGMAARAATVVVLLTAPLKGGWLPYAFSQEDSPEARENFVKVFRAYVKLGGWGVGFVSLLAPVLIIILGSDKYLAATAMVGPLAAAQFLQGASYLLNTPLLISKRTGLYTLASSAGATAVIMANIMVVPALGAMGAAVAQAIGMLALDLMLFAVGQRVLKIPYPVGYVFIPFAVGLGAGFVERFFHPSIAIWPRIGIGVAMGAGALWHMRGEISAIVSRFRARRAAGNGK